MIKVPKHLPPVSIGEPEEPIPGTQPSPFKAMQSVYLDYDHALGLPVVHGWGLKIANAESVTLELTSHELPRMMIAVVLDPIAP